MNHSVLKDFNRYIDTEDRDNINFTPTKESSKGFEVSRGEKHVKFIDFQTNGSRKPK